MRKRRANPLPVLCGLALIIGANYLLAPGSFRLLAGFWIVLIGGVLLNWLEVL